MSDILPKSTRPFPMNAEHLSPSGRALLDRRGTGQQEAYDWAVEFDTVVQDQIKKGQLDALAHFQKLGPTAQLSHPTHEHYLPLLYAAGAATTTEMPRFFPSCRINRSTMRSSRKSFPYCICITL